MVVPKPPNFDAVAWRDRLKEAIPKRPNPPGTVIAIWEQLPPFVLWLRGQRDILATHEIRLNDHKGDLDVHGDRLNIHANRLAALEAQPTSSPFPDS